MTCTFQGHDVVSHSYLFLQTDFRSGAPFTQYITDRRTQHCSIRATVSTITTVDKNDKNTRDEKSQNALFLKFYAKGGDILWRTAIQTFACTHPENIALKSVMSFRCAQITLLIRRRQILSR